MIETFHSSLAPRIVAFLQEKHACGYRYVTETAQLRRLDRFLHENQCLDQMLPRILVERWTAKRLHERPRTHKARLRMVRQFAIYLRQHGIEAYAPDSKLAPVARLDFTPYIFTRRADPPVVGNRRSPAL